MVFVAGPEGSGHEALGEALMRLRDLRPMSLVEEQTFVHLWWEAPGAAAMQRGGGAADAGNVAVGDVEVLRSAQEVVNDWAAAARRSGGHVAFGARSCLRFDGGDCSWIAAIQQQYRHGHSSPRSLRHGSTF